MHGYQAYVCLGAPEEPTLAACTSSTSGGTG